MWVEVDKNDKVIYHFKSGEVIPKLDMADEIVLHVYQRDCSDILAMLVQINNRRLRVTLETALPFNTLTPLVKKYIDEYINVFDNKHKTKKEVFEDVFDE